MAEKCSACAKPIDTGKEGIKLWSAWFCSMCFLGQARSLHREIRPEDVELLKVIGREMAGLLPGELLEVILAGYWRRATGRPDAPPREETLRAAGELQRLTAFAYFQREIRLLQTWLDMFTDFVREREAEIRDTMRRLTSGDE